MQCRSRRMQEWNYKAGFYCKGNDLDRRTVDVLVIEAYYWCDSVFLFVLRRLRPNVKTADSTWMTLTWSSFKEILIMRWDSLLHILSRTAALFNVKNKLLNFSFLAGRAWNVNRRAPLPVWLQWGWVWELWRSATAQDHKLQVSESKMRDAMREACVLTRWKEDFEELMNKEN